MNVNKTKKSFSIKQYKDYLYIEVMPEDKNNVPFYVKNGFSVMENGAAIQICNLCEEK